MCSSDLVLIVSHVDFGYFRHQLNGLLHLDAALDNIVYRFERIVIFFTLLENLLRFHEAVQRVLGSGGSLHYLLGGEIGRASCRERV